MEQEAIHGNLFALVDEGETDSEDSRTYRIGELSKEFGVTLRTLRFYEDRQLLSPRRAGATRLYSTKDRERLKLILLAKRSGFTLAEIEDILAVNDQGELTRETATKLIEKFERQIGVLHERRDEIDTALSEIGEAIEYLRDRL